jgi:RNA polymerase subunit RPABC4/transcription elongation factor Spt4
MFCGNCGTNIPDDSIFCGICGWKVPGTAENQNVNAQKEEDDVHKIAAELVEEEFGSKKCPNCGKPVENDWLTCPFCKSNLSQDCHCGKCGKKLDSNWEICPFCGFSVKQNGNSYINEKMLQQPVNHEQIVPAKKKIHIVFNILSVLFTCSGLIGISYSTNEILSTTTGMLEFYISLGLSSIFIGECAFILASASCIAAGIIFSIISLYIKRSKAYFIFCIIYFSLTLLWYLFLTLSFF